MLRASFLIGSFLLLTSCQLLFGDSITYTVTSNGGQTNYEFTLSNTGDTVGTLFDLFLSIPIDIGNVDTNSISAPVGWGDPTGGLLFFGPDVNPSTSFIEWSSDASGLYDVQIGSSLGGFSFMASQPVTAPITFALNGSSSFDTARQTSTVPELNTISMLLFSSFAIWCLIIGSRLRSASNSVRIKVTMPATLVPFGEMVIALRTDVKNKIVIVRS
jgi:hypothetical protein